MRFTPLTSFNSYITNDIVRFWIPMIKGFWDPYKSYIEIQVQVDEADFPYGHAIQVDNSASNFINQLTVYVDSKQIERIQEYDTIAALLHDAMYKPSDKHGKEYQGTGYASHNSQGFCVDTRRTVSSMAHNYRGFEQRYAGLTTGTSAVSGTQDQSHYTQYRFNCKGYYPQHPLYITPNRVVYPVLNAFIFGNSTTSGSGVFSTPFYPSTSADTANRGALMTVGGHPRFQFPRKGIDPLSFFTGPAPNGIPGGASISTSQPHVIAMYSRAHPVAFQFLFLHGGNNGFQCVTDTNLYVSNGFANKQLACARPWIQSHLESSAYGIQGTDAQNFVLASSYNIQNNASQFNSNNVGPYGGWNSLSLVSADGYTQAFSEQLSNSSYETVFAPAH